VLFGGLTGYASDDINKFLWMVRIGGSVYDWIKEPDYFSRRGEFRVDKEGSPLMLNTLMYKMCYYRFGEVMTEYGTCARSHSELYSMFCLSGLTPVALSLCDATHTGKPTGWDRVRNYEIGNKDFKLDYIEEAFTSEHWLVRIYKVKDLENRS